MHNSAQLNLLIQQLKQPVTEIRLLSTALDKNMEELQHR